MSRDNFVLYNTNEVEVSAQTGKSNHPVDSWKSGETFYAFEGYAYEWENHRQKLESLVHKLVESENPQSILEDTFANLDAEFVFFFHHSPSGKCGVINDVLGRFPLYQTETDQGHLITRNASEIGRTKNTELDRIGAAQSLAFGFTLGTKTIYRGVTRVDGGSYLSFSKSKFEALRYASIDYDRFVHGKTDPEKAIEDATELFQLALERRTKHTSHSFLALSGGLDSQALAGAFDQLNLPFEMATYKDAFGTADKDIEVAKLIAQAHQKELALITLESPAKSDFQELFDLKKGQSMLDMAFMTPFLKSLSQRHKGSAVFTGDGGDKVLPSLLPESRFFSGPKLKTYALRANLKFSEVKAAKLFGLDTKSIQDFIDQLFDGYPEKTWEGKYLRFTMENRARNWLFEGEDRNRCFLPSFTPFYSLPLFNLLMSVGDKEKRDFVFFDKFLKSVAPKTSRIKNANWGFSSENRKLIRKIYLREELKLTGPGKLIKKQLKKSENYFEQASAAELSLFEEHLSFNRESGRMDFGEIKKLNNLGADPFYYLLTLLMAFSETSVELR